MSKYSDDLQKSFSDISVIIEEQKTFQGAIKWCVPEFELREYLQKLNGYYIDSNTFSIGTPAYCSFYLRIHPREALNRHEACPSQPDTTVYWDNVEVSIIFNRKLPDNAWIEGDVYFEGIGVHKTFSVSGKDCNKKIHLGYLCRNVDLHRHFYIKNGCNMYCSMKIREKEVKVTFDKEKTCHSESRNYDSNKKTVYRESFSNVSITVNGHLFKTHKTVLAQIPYFQELFEANESEQHFELSDIKQEIFNHILTYLYSGKCPKLDFKLACELYVAGCDLKISDLKCLCASYLGAILNEVSVALVLKLAHEYGDIDLKKECFKFIKRSDVQTLAEKSIVV